ncbi:MAG TPA: cytochrome c oxidase subunit 3 [Gammaproteobacteria bacterium]|nr:cytochrome c oxidase subunit 3 [Gammaproteobacteria bacterium]
MSTKPEQVKVQFETLDQQQSADRLGMWIFLATETMLFGGLFFGYTAMHTLHPQIFDKASHELEWQLEFINTAILLTSGLTMALAEFAVAAKRRWLTLFLLILTLFFGAWFLTAKGIEYLDDFSNGIVPFVAGGYHYSGLQPQIAKLFFNFYFALTGLHAFHMSIGMLLLMLMAWLTFRWRDPDKMIRRLRIVGFYWAFIDVAWITIYTTIYLVPR